MVESHADDGERDALVQRVRETLAPLPPRDAAAIARILAATETAGPRGAASSADVVSLDSRRRRGRWAVAGATLLAAAAAVTLLVRGTNHAIGRTVPTRPGAPIVASRPLPSPDSGIDMRVVGAVADGEAQVPVQFTLDGAAVPEAARVVVVGDFNDWNENVAPLAKLPGTSVWTTTIAVRPGRHTYAFVVDGARWIADPRAPRAADDDFGRVGSVVMVSPR